MECERDEKKSSHSEEESSSLSLELVVDKAQDEQAREDNMQNNNMYDYDPETMKDKPWLKPGANISDYFNYGFTERTWRKYCETQRTNREWVGKQDKYEREGGEERSHRRRRSSEDEHYNRRPGNYR